MAEKQKSDNPELTEALVNREALKIWEQYMKLRINGISRQTRKALAQILGKPRAKELPNAVDSQTARRIYKEIVQTHTGLYQYIGRGDNIERTIINWGSKGQRELRNVVDDPQSKEARVLAWLYTQFIDAVNADEFRRIFLHVPESQINDGKRLIEAKTKSNALMSDASNLGIGNEIYIADETDERKPWLIPTGSTGQFAELQKKIVNIHNRALKCSPSEKEKRDALLDKLDEEKNNRDALRKKRDKVKQELGEISKIFGSVQGGLMWTNAEIDSISCDLDKALETGAIASTDIRIDRQAKKVSDWIQDEQLERIVKQADLTRTQYKGGPLKASIVLDRFLAKHFEDEIKDLSEADKAKFISDMKATFLSESQGTAPSATGSISPVSSSGGATPKASSEKEKKPSKFKKALKDFGLGLFGLRPEEFD